MLNRQSLLVSSIVVALLAGLIPVLTLMGDAGQTDELTAEQLYRQGMQQFAEGDLDAAMADLKRVDSAQLEKDDRTKLLQTLQDIERQQKGGDAVGTLLAEGDAAQREGRHQQAIAIYQRVLAHEQATADHKDLAKGRLADSRRKLNVELTGARQSIDAAAADLMSGNAARAKRRLAAVEQTGVELNSFDKERLNRYMTQANQALAAQDVQTETVVAADPVAPVEADPVAQDAPEAAAEAPMVEVEAAPAPAAQAPSDDLMVRARKFRAEELVAKGKEAELNGQYRTAQAAYTQALESDPTNQAATAGLASVETKLDAASAAGSIIDNTLRDRNLRAEAAVAEYREAINTAAAQMAADNFAGAELSAQRAETILKRNENVLPREQYLQYRQEIDTVAAQIKVTKLQIDEQRRQDIEKTRQEEERNARDTIATANKQQVNRLIRRVYDLRRDQEYAQALQLIDQVLFIDPTNDSAKLIREMLVEAEMVVGVKNLYHEQYLLAAEHRRDGLEATLPYNTLVNYPTDWVELSMLRLGKDIDDAEQDQNNRTLRLLSQVIPVNFENNDLSNVISYFQNTTGANFFVNWPQLLEVGLEQDTQVTLQLSAVPASKALDLLMRQFRNLDPFNPPAYSVVDGIVTISTKEDLRSSLERKTYNIRDLLIRTDRLPNIGSGGEDDDDDDDDDDGGGDDDDDDDDGDPDALAEDIIILIEGSVGEESDWRTNGGPQTITNSSGNLVIVATVEAHREIEALLYELRRERGRQVNVEARFLALDQNFLNEVGIDLDINIVNPGAKFGPIGISQDSYSVATVASSEFPAGTGITAPFTPGLGFGSTGRALDLSVSYLDDVEVNLLVKATQAQDRGILLTAPRVTLPDGGIGEVTFETTQERIGSLDSTSGSENVSPDVSEAEPSGISFRVQAFISADNRYVTIITEPELTQTSLRSVNFTFSGGGTTEDDSGDTEVDLPATTSLELQTVVTQGARTIVTVPDKGTLLMGGQRVIREREVESGVPVLAKIPYLNRLFSNRAYVKEEQTLLILIKPTIMLQAEQEDSLFPGLAEQLKGGGGGTAGPDPRYFTGGTR